MNLSVASFVTCPYCESVFFCLAEGRQVLFSACRNTLLVEVARLYVPDSQGTSGRASHSISGSGKLFKNPCSQAELNKIVPFGFSLQRQKMVFFCH